MSYDNAERFRFFVMQNCVLPRQDGGMQKLKRGAIVTGAHYARFTKTGILQQIEVAEVKPSPAPASAPAPVPAKEALSREELDSMTKRELMERYDPAWTGTKSDLITKILKG